MKTSINKNTGNVGNPQPFLRIVIKFRMDGNLGLVAPTEVNNYFFQNGLISLSRFQKTISGMTISSLFSSLTPVEIRRLVTRATAADATYCPPDFGTYYAIDCPKCAETRELLETLMHNEHIELAYLVHDATPPHGQRARQTSEMSQRYLDPAPTGINAEYAWRFKGGDGKGSVKFVDIEQGWILDHESLTVNSLPHTGINHAFHDHGAAVLGVIMMKDRGPEGRGITPNVKAYVVSQWRSNGFLNNADAIMAAIRELKFGDIILLQAQVRDSTYRKNLWPVETHEATFQVIRLAHALGIVVIEAAGNGDLYLHAGNDLDQFVSNGENILDRKSRSFKDSGAVMVAAASSTPPHKRVHDSNYGSRIDCYAWGENVATSGSFPFSSGHAKNTYTKRFCGTSSAAAIVGGAALCVQCIAEAKYKFRLSPAEMRRILSGEEYGTPSSNGHFKDKIGVMPDLKKIIDEALPAVAHERRLRKNERAGTGQDQ